MFSNAWMRLTGCLLLTLVFCAACSEMPAPFKKADRSPRADRPAPYDPPSTYPGWAYDAPEHMKPAEELTPEPRIKRTDPLHYFTNEKVVMVRQPSGYTPEETPRVSLWWTDNNGFHWQKAGYFGREQSYFPFEVNEDGDYGVRFVGPGQSPAVETPAYPERVYHVDTTLPEVEVSIEPNKSWYSPGDQVTIKWNANDYHLIEYPVQIGMLVDYSAEEYKLVELQRDLADEGSITYEIPRDTLDHEIRFRVEASDRAGNLGLAFSYALQVVDDAIVKGHMDDEMIPPSNEPAAEPEIESTTQIIEPEEQFGPPFVEEQFAANTDLVSVPFATEFAITNEDDTLFAWSDPFFGPQVPEETDDTPFPIIDESQSIETPEAFAAAEPTELPVFVAPTFPAITPMMFSGPMNLDNTVLDDESMTETESNVAIVTPTEEKDSKIIEAPVVAKIETPVETPAEKQATIAAKPIDHEPRIIEDIATTPAFDAPAIKVIDAPSIERIDPTHGNGILIPLPATIQPEPKTEQHATAHPWRILVNTSPAAERTVWSLPSPRHGFNAGGDSERRLYADHPALRPVAAPGDAQHAVADVTSNASTLPEIDVGR